MCVKCLDYEILNINECLYEFDYQYIKNQFMLFSRKLMRKTKRKS